MVGQSATTRRLRSTVVQGPLSCAPLGAGDVSQTDARGPRGNRESPGSGHHLQGPAAGYYAGLHACRRQLWFATDAGSTAYSPAIEDSTVLVLYSSYHMQIVNSTKRLRYLWM
jgi:hypothetical protein